MPKINVYVPDELAEAIRETGIPVSAVCQRALEAAVRRVTAIREATIMPNAGLSDNASHTNRFTERAHTVVRLAAEDARAHSAPEVGTEHLLAGILAEGGNLALDILRAIEIEPATIRRALRHHGAPAQPENAETAENAQSAEGTEDAQDADIPPATASDRESGEDLRFSSHAAAALELAVTEASSLGHNYVGTEHLLLGLIAEPDGVGGHLLRGLGAELRLTRRATNAALAAYVHLRAQLGQNQGQGQEKKNAPTLTDPVAKLNAAIEQQLKPVVERLNRIEGNLGL